MWLEFSTRLSLGALKHETADKWVKLGGLAELGKAGLVFQTNDAAQSRSLRELGVTGVMG